MVDRLNRCDRVDPNALVSAVQPGVVHAETRLSAPHLGARVIWRRTAWGPPCERDPYRRSVCPASGPGTGDRRTWTMPPIESLRPPACSAWRTLGLVVLRCYLLATITVLVVRAVQIALGSG